MSGPDQDPDGPSFWVNTVSLEHVRLGVEGGFTQADHGRSTRLKRLRASDGLVFYSPRTSMRGGAALQQFTALGRVTDTEPYQVQLTAEFHVWRRNVEFLKVTAAPARALVADLDFIPDPKRWGYPFRRGLFAIDRSYFVRIASAMGIDWDAVAASGER